VHTVIVIDIIIYYRVYTQELSNGTEFTKYEGWNVIHYMYIKVVLKFALLQRGKYSIFFKLLLHSLHLKFCGNMHWQCENRDVFSWDMLQNVEHLILRHIRTCYEGSV
jgi:hypothetical protein